MMADTLAMMKTEEKATDFSTVGFTDLPILAITVGPRLIGPIGTEDFLPLSQDNL